MRREHNAFHSRDAYPVKFMQQLMPPPRDQKTIQPRSSAGGFNRQLIDFLTHHLIILFRIVVTDAE
jgi:hypothetical protein